MQQPIHLHLLNSGQVKMLTAQASKGKQKRESLMITSKSPGWLHHLQRQRSASVGKIAAGKRAILIVMEVKH